MRLTVYYRQDDGSNGIPKFEINLVHKVNILLGNSGVGKSWLVDDLTNTSVYNIECDTEVYVVARENMLIDACKSKEGILIVYDEDLASKVREHRLTKVIEKSRNYFLIVSRDYKDIGNMNIDAVFRVYRNYVGDLVQIKWDPCRYVKDYMQGRTKQWGG